MIVSLLLRLAWKTVLILKELGQVELAMLGAIESIVFPFQLRTHISFIAQYLLELFTSIRQHSFLSCYSCSFISAVACTIITFISDIVLLREIGHRITHDCHTNGLSRQSLHCLQYLVLWSHSANGLETLGISSKWDVCLVRHWLG